MKLIVKVALIGVLGIGAVAAASQLHWRTAEPAATSQRLGPAPAIAAVSETSKPNAEPAAAQPAQEKQAAVAKPAVKKKRKKQRKRRRT